MITDLLNLIDSQPGDCYALLLTKSGLNALNFEFPRLSEVHGKTPRIIGIANHSALKRLMLCQRPLASEWANRYRGASDQLFADTQADITLVDGKLGVLWWEIPTYPTTLVRFQAHAQPTGEVYVLGIDGFVPLNLAEAGYVVELVVAALGGNPCDAAVQDSLMDWVFCPAPMFPYLHAFNHIFTYFDLNEKYQAIKRFYARLGEKLLDKRLWHGHDVQWHRLLAEYAKSGELEPLPPNRLNRTDRRLEIVQAMAHYRLSLKPHYRKYAKDLNIQLEMAKLSGV